ncbi:Os11g0659000 [Oryza sativa Japonica Group]|uniref:Os11g0659000 protein n=1 Tax=Oryza sativa subsp. japonica TaxID=39947 RepID=A0A0P0Y521_ORYSJ|nr:Os11g0659000 [Oryza sativa Japonica Group]
MYRNKSPSAATNTPPDAERHWRPWLQPSHLIFPRLLQTSAAGKTLQSWRRLEAAWDLRGSCLSSTTFPPSYPGAKY